MNTNCRADLFAALAELSRRYPDWRIGQLMVNVAGWADEDVWNVEDDRLLEAANCQLQRAQQPAGKRSA